MVVRQDLHRRRGFWLGMVPCLALTVVQPRFLWGSLAVAVAALGANGKLTRRVAVAAMALAIGGVAHSFGRRADFVFAYGHNLVALAMWAAWAREHKRQVLPALALYIAAAVAIFTGQAEALLFRLGTLAASPISLELGRLARELSPVADPHLALRFVLFFAFGQSVHYAVWLQILPEEDRARAGIRPFWASYRSLLADLGPGLVALALVLTIACVVMGSIALASARAGYLRLALFHGPLELAVATQLWVERRSIARADSQ
jgi:hypothetical protein